MWVLDLPQVWVLDLPLTPRSFNQTVYANWRVASKAKAELQEQLGIAILVAGVPLGLQCLTASATLSFPTSRRRDEGNYRTPLEKALGDALVARGVLADDTPSHYRFGHLAFERGRPRTLIRLEACE